MKQVTLVEWAERIQAPLLFYAAHASYANPFVGFHSSSLENIRPM